MVARESQAMQMAFAREHGNSTEEPQKSYSPTRTIALTPYCVSDGLVGCYSAFTAGQAVSPNRVQF